MYRLYDILWDIFVLNRLGLEFNVMEFSIFFFQTIPNNIVLNRDLSALFRLMEVGGGF